MRITNPRTRNPENLVQWEKKNHKIVIRNALIISLIIYFVNNFLIIHPYDVTAFILQCEEVD